ncbi:MAG: D-alanine--D-alanine ligase [Planctomycetes bacterium]|nr:D-alanine--D-alanine ligase [Planctomycetota bacterium]MBI3833777.1 D-alanine--D-alanine ligase [Planctomycetota bacterium]
MNTTTTHESPVGSAKRNSTRSMSPHKPTTLDITVLAGGPGMEREVSLNSGQAVRDALVRLGHYVELCDIGPQNVSALDRPADFVFIALHGEFGEDGTVQAELERRKIPYCGSNATASRLAMDKVQAKRRLEDRGIPTPKYVVADRHNVGKIASLFEPIAVVKPVLSGSSVDTTIARTSTALQASARAVVGKYGAALVEKYVSGRELTVGILGDVALPICEIRTRREFYDYQAKYIDDDTQYLFDIDLPADLQRRVQEMSLGAHRALGCEVFSRADVMVDAKTLEPYLLEINTIPGFTSHSLLPKAAARVGIGFDGLCQRIIELSFAAKR